MTFITTLADSMGYFLSGIVGFFVNLTPGMMLFLGLISILLLIFYLFIMWKNQIKLTGGSR